MKLLKYLPSTIADAEAKYGRNMLRDLSELATNPSMTSFIFLIECGGGTREYADKLFADGGIDRLSAVVVQGLTAFGFLGEKQTLTVEEIEKKGKETRDQMIKELSQNGGEAKKN